MTSDISAGKRGELQRTCEHGPASLTRELTSWLAGLRSQFYSSWQVQILWHIHILWGGGSSSTLYKVQLLVFYIFECGIIAFINHRGSYGVKLESKFNWCKSLILAQNELFCNQIVINCKCFWTNFFQSHQKWFLCLLSLRDEIIPSNLDVGTSAIFGFLYPIVSFSERSENPLIPSDPQILKPHRMWRGV